MNRLDEVFARLRNEKKKALIAYLTAGYPSFNTNKTIIETLQNSGVHILEIGIPFSDPIADGPTIQFASHQALLKGTSLRKALGFIRSLTPKVTMPIVIMSYLNPILAMGVKRFAKAASQSGVSGLIVPDLIPEEAAGIRRELIQHGIYLIFLVAPTTSGARRRKILRETRGFLYAVSVTGVTGARKKFASQTKKWLRQLSCSSRVPVCVGFGISGKAQVRELKQVVDGFIFGSALIDLIRRDPDHKKRNKRVARFVQTLDKEANHGR